MRCIWRLRTVDAKVRVEVGAGDVAGRNATLFLLTLKDVVQIDEQADASERGNRGIPTCCSLLVARLGETQLECSRLENVARAHHVLSSRYAGVF